ncbi:MAG: allantoate deiminase [Atopobiaceae bacterium]|jgi:allantoate deiminase
MSVTNEQIEEIIDWLAQFGFGGPDQGMTRLLYTPEWLQAQQAIKERFVEAGMTAEFDAVGNLKGVFEGSDPDAGVVASGSHVDTVVHGGKLDGALGIEAAYLAMTDLVKTYGQPKKSMAVVSLAEEEGSRFPYVFWGSKNLFDLQDNNQMTDIKDAKGVSFIDAMHGCGFDFNQGHDALLDGTTNWLELHIEQGNTLEMEGEKVGVVHGIVGQRRYDIHLRGEANHAGTTMMRYRHDVVQAYAKIVSQSIEKAKAEGDPLVLTFGKVEVTPNVVNVVPGEMTFTMDCRHTDRDFLVSFTDGLTKDMQEICKDMGIEIEIDNWMDEDPVPMDEKMIDVVRRACQTSKLNYREMHSGAGHDSQIIAKHIPSAMIFVPSIAGVSHNPAEWTAIDDIRQGVLALEAALYELAY